MKVTSQITRRTMLRGVGAALCLPLLESFGPRSPLAASEAIKSPKRLIFLSYSWVSLRNDWFPKEPGADYELTECLRPMQRHKADFFRPEQPIEQNRQLRVTGERLLG